MTTSLSDAGLMFADTSIQPTAATGFGFKNRIINGAMVIDQRNAGASVTPSAVSQFMTDRFVLIATQASKFSFQQVTDVPTGFNSSLRLSVAATATPTASDQFRMGQAIEGFNVADFGWGTSNAQPATVSFRAKASVAGSYSVALWNAANGRSYVTTVALTASWATYTFAVLGDTTGTWATGNTTGIELVFDLGGGSSWVAPATNAWQSGNYFKASGTVSFVGNAGATLNITGVQLEKGSTATAFDYRDFGRELILCQRYYEQIGIVNQVGYSQSLTTFFVGQDFKVAKRAYPTVTFTGTANVVYGSALTTTSSTYAADSGSPERQGFQVVTAAVLTPGGAGRLQSGTTLLASAEL